MKYAPLLVFPSYLISTSYLSPAFAADSRRGIYIAQDALYDTLKFKKFGPVTVGGVPFNIVDPAKTAGGKNLIVLKGGGSGS